MGGWVREFRERENNNDKTFFLQTQSTISKVTAYLSNTCKKVKFIVQTPLGRRH